MATMHPLRFGLKTSQRGSSYQEILPCWEEGDQVGADTAWMYDHFAEHRGGQATPCDDGWTLLGAMLAKTERIRGGLMVTGNTHRHPVLLAKIAATVDHISNGRLEFGFGTGWSIPEHEMFGWELPPMPERVRWFNDACQIIKRLWTEPEVSFESDHYHLKDAVFADKPVQTPYPHFVIGASGEKLTIRSVVQHADEWNWVGGPVDEYKRKLAALDGHLRDLGRDPASLQRSVQIHATQRGGSDTEVVAEVKDILALGADHFIFGLAHPYSPRQVTHIWQEIVPAIRDSAGR
jgi:alkanesulfonate monooxygenase SsuD/methylene tetrahydromethanopterin reductase-like flavin-dependent oxidoreductase (luciferase family)